MKKTLLILLSTLSLFANSDVIELESITVYPDNNDIIIYQNIKKTEFLYCNKKNKYYYENENNIEVLDVNLDFVEMFLFENKSNIISDIEVKNRLDKCQKN